MKTNHLVRKNNPMHRNNGANWLSTLVALMSVLIAIPAAIWVEPIVMGFAAGAASIAAFARVRASHTESAIDRRVKERRRSTPQSAY